MDILIRGLESLFRRQEILLVRRTPPTKTLRAQLFGLTLALVGTLFTIFADHSTLFESLAPYAPMAAIGLFILAAGLFILGSYIGGPFVILTMIVFLTSPQPQAPPTFFSSLRILAAWYFTFYAIGAVLALLYNFFVFLNLIAFGQKQIKIAFAYDTRKKINIIKSPDAIQELAFGEVVTQTPEMKRQKLYHFELKAPPKHPYTIAFVVNPKIYRRTKNALGAYNFRYESDPLLANPDLFLRSVNNALHSFERDEVVGRPEIWSRVRVITIFEDTNTGPVDELSLVQDFQEGSDPSEKVTESLIFPRPEMNRNVALMLKRHANDLPADLRQSLSIKDIDVIYALTASPTEIRPTAYYADYDERSGPRQPSPQGKKFHYNRDPNNNKDDEISEIKDPCKTSPFACVHDDFAASEKNSKDEIIAWPGRVAMNVLSARRHTVIHEFAHAMSSVVRGAICDEYYDKSFLKNRKAKIFTPFYVNRIERTEYLTPEDARFVAVHQAFAKYNDTVFLTDLVHPSAKEGWLSYFPERESANVDCTMDRIAEPFRFDKLLSRFIYDRLVSKLNRPHKP